MNQRILKQAVVLGLVFASLASADLVVVSEYLGPGLARTSRGIGGALGDSSFGSQSFIPTESGVLQEIRLIIQNRNASSAFNRPLKLDMYNALPDSNQPDLDAGSLGYVTLMPSDIPITNSVFSGAFDDVMTVFDFSSGPEVNLSAGQEYVMVLTADGVSNIYNTSSAGFGWLTPSLINNGIDGMNVNFMSGDGSDLTTLSSYSGDYDAFHQVLIPEPSVLGLLGLAGLTQIRRRRK